MPEPTNGDIVSTLVDIQVNQGVIQANQESLRREFEREREGADRHRRGLTETIAALSEAVRALTAQMAEVMPLSAAYREASARQRGMADLGRIMWAAMIAIGALVGAVVSKVIDHLK